MKELHNHIFSNTTCISKETMLKFINKQLSKKELYEVEKHMLDCELCSDAYTGMQFAENSSMLFAIDHAIDKRVGAKSAKAPIMRNLMLAASVLVIVFGTYFTVDYFNKVANNEQGLAINEEKEAEGFVAPKAETLELGNEAEIDVDEVSEKEEQAAEISPNDNISLAENKDKTLENTPKPVVTRVEVDNFMSEDAEDFDDLEVAAAEPVLLDEVEEQLEEIQQITATGNVITSADEVLKKKEKVAEKSKSNRKRNQKSTAAEAPAQAAKFAASETTKVATEPNDYMLTIEGFKVVDYKQEYQDAYDREDAKTIVTESVSAGFESKNDKDLANKELEATIVEVTYKDALDKAMRLFKSQKYSDALQEFDNIEVKHPEEVNAHFYSGLCYYHLGQNAAAIKKFDRVLKNRQTEFNEEANWYKALTLLNMKSTTAAKKLLKTIVAQNGFYKTKAEEKLVELK